MNPNPLTPIERIRLISGRMKLAYKALMALFSLIVLFALVTIALDVGTVRSEGWALGINLSDLFDPGFDRDAHWHMSVLSFGEKLLVALYLLILAGYVNLLLFYQHALFSGFAEGEIFTRASVSQIRRIGILLLIGAALPVPLYAIIKVLKYLVVDLPLQNDLIFSISLNPTWLFFVVTGFSVLVVSRVNEVGLELREERELTI